VNAMREGASDFVVKPWDNAKLVATVSSVARLAQADREVASLRRRQRTLSEYIGQDADPIVGNSVGLRQVLASIDKVARTEANVLILGENGTGKELIARPIHRQSFRRDQVFIGVDLGAIATNLRPADLRAPARFRQDLLYRINTIEIEVPRAAGIRAGLPQFRQAPQARIRRRRRRTLTVGASAYPDVAGAELQADRR
jgi:DNA-binding NtrC family response regulator